MWTFFVGILCPTHYVNRQKVNSQEFFGTDFASITTTYGPLAFSRCDGMYYAVRQHLLNNTTLSRQLSTTLSRVLSSAYSNVTICYAGCEVVAC